MCSAMSAASWAIVSTVRVWGSNMSPINWIEVGGAATVGLLLIFGTHHYDRAVFEVEKAAAISTQQTADVKSCDADKAKTKEANDDLQNNLNAIKRKLADAKRVHPSACVPIIAGRTDMAGVHGEHAGQNGNGISSDWLRDYGATCEEIHQTLNVCEKFVHDERAGK